MCFRNLKSEYVHSRTINTLTTLASLHYEHGFIDRSEFEERLQVAYWLCDDAEDCNVDPRRSYDEDAEPNQSQAKDEHDFSDSLIVNMKNDNSKSEKEDEHWLHLLFLKTWVFTKSDPDSYPSIPHGHFQNKNKQWPKLNPYTGRVFSGKHKEDTHSRLDKDQLNTLWNDHRFRSFCRDMLVWYIEKFPYYEFPMLDPLRLPRRRR